MEVSTTTIALGVATLVVLILLMSCSSTSKRQGSGSRYAYASGSGSRCASRSSASPVYKDLDETGAQVSRWGQGVSNRQMNSQYNDLNNLKGYDDYNSVAQYQSLEPEVYDSHKEYSSNIGVASSGASALSVASHDNYPVQWVGLRRPDMQSIYAGSDARQQHSEYVDQMPNKTNYTL